MNQKFRQSLIALTMLATFISSVFLHKIGYEPLPSSNAPIKMAPQNSTNQNASPLTHPAKSPSWSDPTASSSLKPPPAPLNPPNDQPPKESHPNYPYTALLDNTNSLYASEPFISRINAAAALASISNNNLNSPIVAVIDTGFSLDHDNLRSRWLLKPDETGPTTLGSAQNCTSQGLALDKRCNNYDNNGDGYKSNWRGWDFVGNDNDPSAGTTNGSTSTASHGTLTASLAAILNPNARIMPLQALDDDGSGYTDTVAAAIRYAADHGANVISLSLGSPYDDLYLRSQIGYAISKGVVVIAAAGNSGCDCLSYPAAYPEVLSVGASDANDYRAAFSSYGSNLDIVAPGTAGDVCAALWTTSNPTSAYSCSYSGTSFAAPITASLALLIQTQNPSATVNDIIRFITQNADKVSGMGGQDQTPTYGYGRINAYKSILAASLAAPQGQLINKTTASLSSSNLAAGPLLNSTCEGIPGATCDIRLTSSNGDVIKYLGAQSLDSYGGANFTWNAADIGLTPGQWKIESILSSSGQTTVKPATYITINP
jgi:hypothetical protein